MTTPPHAANAPSVFRGNAPDSVKITSEVLSNFRIGKVLKESQGTITSADFDSSGQYCITTATDKALQLYDCRSASSKKTIRSELYGAHLARFTHHSNNVVYASTKGEDAVRYLSLHDNRFLRVFKGHTDAVTAINVHPLKDEIMTASMDQTVRMWDFRAPGRQTGYMQFKNGKQPLIAYDPSGKCFAVAEGSKRILFFDPASLDQGPFYDWQLSSYVNRHPVDEKNLWTSMQFTADGQYLIIGTFNDVILVVDALDGYIVYQLTGHISTDDKLGSVGRGSEIAVTPDSAFVLTGSQDGSVFVWDISKPVDPKLAPKELQPLGSLEGHSEPIRTCAFNHKLLMMMTGCDAAAFWSVEREEK